LGFVLALYAALAVVLLAGLGADLAATDSAFLDFYRSLSIEAALLVKFVVSLASLGSILALLAGVSRTAATMAEDGELPKRFEQRNRFGSPWLAEVIIAVGASILVLSASLPAVIGFSSFSVLLYYSIAHLSALSQPSGERALPRLVASIGLSLSIWLAISVPENSAWQSAIVLVVALALRSIAKRRKTRLD
jgi:APA family basic amino acid/polyamine antiporter